MFDFLLSISRALPELIPVFGRGERIISKDWVGDGITGLSKMCCVMLRCNALYGIVMSYNVFVSCCTQSYCVSFC